DTIATLDALRSLGAGVEQQDGAVLIRGVGLRTAAPTTGGLLDVRNSGTLLRILPGWLAGQPGGIWTLDGDESIRTRPVDRVVEPLRLMGARVDARDGRLPPLTVQGADLTGIDYELPMASAQVKSCVLVAGMLAEGPTSITEPERSRDHTERILTRARVPCEREGRTVRVSPVDELELDDVIVPGDPPSGAFIAAAARVVPGSGGRPGWRGRGPASVGWGRKWRRRRRVWCGGGEGDPGGASRRARRPPPGDAGGGCGPGVPRRRGGRRDGGRGRLVSGIRGRPER